ncbi:hypothetical protein VOLCADRAFT_56657 [Volvox carteri f. nagariensis]|uniref:Nudix hydrolase domain-containing protein n=1 Tax=Volvox carteri f. nagariensis TaxID=3068 RepID=D8TLD5_VOLCA|nr:uncharacterized protein VOLCADRAFT_56657 [Volvox carteri f. nagariensis]EFJ51856.1 hypothetical protein VOLCADRAFT_56657 [Volvox carteri f. nagariensis]|eukprot:XP_002947266.1 hypothetical protein VOLCADRAFT_56657 [Volvox carteri f. nagariensis]
MTSSENAGSSLLIGGPVPGSSRQGRHKQRYGEAGERLVAGCIPVRFSGCTQSAQHVEVCMITTASGNGLVFPKGGWEDDESVESAAQRETVEEAGVRGVLEEPLLGVFPFSGGKHVYDAQGNPVGKCKAFIYVMHVAEELPSWPESNDRQRIWCTIAEATRQCKHQWMREALRAWVRRKGWDEVLEPAEGGSNAQHQQQQQTPPLDSSYSCAGSSSARLAEPDVYSFQATEPFMSMSST